MPDRYGENDHEELSTPAERAQLRAAAINNCRLCDDDGYRTTTVCDHTDHTATAKRGMALIRETMGWT